MLSPHIRLLSTRLENLSPSRFILLVGVIGGVLRSYPGTYLDHATIRMIVALAIITDAAAVLLWWVAVRRRRFSFWKTALHVMLALDLADALALLLSIAMLSLDARGHLVNTFVHQPLSTILGGLVPPYVVFSAIRFLGAAVLVAIGRRLPGSGQPSIDRQRHMHVSTSS